MMGLKKEFCLDFLIAKITDLYHVATEAKRVEKATLLMEGKLPIAGELMRSQTTASGKTGIEGLQRNVEKLAQSISDLTAMMVTSMGSREHTEPGHFAGTWEDQVVAEAEEEAEDAWPRERVQLSVADQITMTIGVKEITQAILVEIDY